jgi:hypothetical protein
MPKTVNELGKIIIEESNLKFGYYSAEDLFHIEESEVYRKLQNSGVKTVEFALIKKNVILLFEVKTTAPKLLESKIKLEEFVAKEIRNTENLDKTLFLNELFTKLKHDNYFDEFLFKFNDSLALLSAIYLNRHDKAKQELPENFKNLELSTLQFVLVLVVKDHPTESLDDLTAKLNKKLKPLVQIWKPTSVAVLNEALARKRGYVVEN